MFLSIWHDGLKKVINKVRDVIQTLDKRTIWLKNNYIQQYIISAGRGPMTADAIRVSNCFIQFTQSNLSLFNIIIAFTYWKSTNIHTKIRWRLFEILLIIQYSYFVYVNYDSFMTILIRFLIYWIPTYYSHQKYIHNNFHRVRFLEFDFRWNNKNFACTELYKILKYLSSIFCTVSFRLNRGSMLCFVLHF